MMCEIINQENYIHAKIITWKRLSALQNFIFQYEGGYVDIFLTASQKNYYNTMKKLGNRKPQKTIKRPKVSQDNKILKKK